MELLIKALATVPLGNILPLTAHATVPLDQRADRSFANIYAKKKCGEAPAAW